jgi:hypothetical protein
MAAAAHQVAECARPELVLSHRHGFVDDERRAARIGQQVLYKLGLERREYCAAVLLS